jgi:hypothetical protein
MLDLIAGITSIIIKRVGEHRHNWARYAEKYPYAAALLLRRTAYELRGTVDAMRPARQKRWIARRRLAKADALLHMAHDIVAFANHRPCGPDPLRRPI